MGPSNETQSEGKKYETVSSCPRVLWDTVSSRTDHIIVPYHMNKVRFCSTFPSNLIDELLESSPFSQHPVRADVLTVVALSSP